MKIKNFIALIAVVLVSYAFICFAIPVILVRTLFEASWHILDSIMFCCVCSLAFGMVASGMMIGYMRYQSDKIESSSDKYVRIKPEDMPVFDSVRSCLERKSQEETMSHMLKVFHRLIRDHSDRDIKITLISAHEQRSQDVTSYVLGLKDF